MMRTFTAIVSGCSSRPQPARQGGFQAGRVTGSVGRRPRYEAVGTHQQAAHPGAVRTTPDQLQTPGVPLSGTALDRFDFTLNLITGGLGRRS
jgi:hypothetical protein